MVRGRWSSLDFVLYLLVDQSTLINTLQRTLFFVSAFNSSNFPSCSDFSSTVFRQVCFTFFVPKGSISGVLLSIEWHPIVVGFGYISSFVFFYFLFNPFLFSLSDSEFFLKMVQSSTGIYNHSVLLLLLYNFFMHMQHFFLQYFSYFCRFH